MADIRAAMQAFLDTFGEGKRGGRGDFLADDVVAWHVRWGEGEIRGKQALLDQYYTKLLESFPDLDFEIVEAHMGDDFVVLRGRFHGTFTKTWAGLEPHGRKVTWKAHDIYHFNGDGKCDRMWLMNDTLTVARQLGALPDDGFPW